MRGISVVVPAFNEGHSLAGNVGQIQAFLRQGTNSECPHEVVIVNDGSSDDTGSVADRLAAEDPAVVSLRHDRNRGLSAAVKTGALAARYDVVVILDADLTYAPEIIGRLYKCIAAGNEVALASAYMRGGSTARVPWLRRLLSSSANVFLSLAVRGEVRTLTCMVRAYNREVLHNLVESAGPQANVTYDLVFAARKAGARIAEIPARLDWSAQPPERARRVSWRNILEDTLRVLIAGLRERPVVAFAIPGLFPGLLPLAVAASLALHATPATVLRVALVTTVIQYGSLAVFSWELGSFLRRIYRRSPSYSTQPQHGVVK